jgi:hypothetical protein
MRRNYPPYFVIWAIEEGGKFEIVGRPSWKDAKEMYTDFVDRSYNYVCIAKNHMDNDIELGKHENVAAVNRAKQRGEI